MDGNQEIQKILNYIVGMMHYMYLSIKNIQNNIQKLLMNLLQTKQKLQKQKYPKKWKNNRQLFGEMKNHDDGDDENEISQIQFPKRPD